MFLWYSLDKRFFCFFCFFCLLCFFRINQFLVHMPLIDISWKKLYGESFVLITKTEKNGLFDYNILCISFTHWAFPEKICTPLLRILDIQGGRILSTRDLPHYRSKKLRFYSGSLIRNWGLNVLFKQTLIFPFCFIVPHS